MENAIKPMGDETGILPPSRYALRFVFTRRPLPATARHHGRQAHSPTQSSGLCARWVRPAYFLATTIVLIVAVTFSTTSTTTM
jgi:hypothetical protein